MRNLTLASAKHLLNMGHITPAHHKRIVAAAAAPSLKMPTQPKPMKPPAGFGSLAKPVAPLPQPGMAASIPGIGPTQNIAAMQPGVMPPED
jgi:hypothetical protein